MTTAKKLWLGFGTLTALLILSSIANIVRVQSIEAQSRELAEAVEQTLTNYARLAATDSQRDMAARFATAWQPLRQLGQTLLDAETRQLSADDSQRFYGLRGDLEKLLGEMETDAGAAVSAFRRTTLQDIRSIMTFAWLVLGAGLVLSIFTGALVGRAVVRGERTVAEHGERLRTALASIGDAVITTDVEGRVTNMNAVAESLTGWNANDAVGQPLGSVFSIVNEETNEPAVAGNAARA